MGLTVYAVPCTPDEYIFVSDDPVTSMWYPLRGTKRFLNACASDQFYFTTLVWTREIFFRKTDSTRRNRRKGNLAEESFYLIARRTEESKLLCLQYSFQRT